MVLCKPALSSGASRVLFCHKVDMLQVYCPKQCPKRCPTSPAFQAEVLGALLSVAIVWALTAVLLWEATAHGGARRRTGHPRQKNSVNESNVFSKRFDRPNTCGFSISCPHFCFIVKAQHNLRYPLVSKRKQLEQVYGEDWPAAFISVVDSKGDEVRGPYLALRGFPRHQAGVNTSCPC